MALATFACQRITELPNGTQKCAPEGNSPRCPTGHVCIDDHCWTAGTGPEGGVTPVSDATPAGGSYGDVSVPGDGASESLDLAGRDDTSPDAAPVPDGPPSPDLAPTIDLPGLSPERHMVSGGTVSRSTRYVAIRTLSQIPGSAVMKSTHYRALRGIVGVTQPR
jgi:hypothetical protein